MVQAASRLISDQGLAGASARAIAAAAGVAPSAINYNFDNLERLLSITFDHGARRTATWLDMRAAELKALPRTPHGAGEALDHVLTAWTGDARDLALMYQEGLAVHAGAGPCATWTRLWRDFWLDVSDTFGLSEDDGRLLHLFFECEALYQLSTWSPALERAALREVIDAFTTTYLAAPRREDGGMLYHAEQTAGTRAPSSIAPAAMRIAVAAAEVVEAAGFGGLTHRAVAARAGVTTGSVTHHFRTIEDLVSGAIRGEVQVLIQAQNASAFASPQQAPLTTERLFESLRYHLLGDRPASPLRRRLFLGAVRRPDLAGAGAIIRFSHGGTTREIMKQAYSLSDGALSLRAGLISRLASALAIACSADENSRASRERILAAIEARYARSLAQT